MKSSKLECVDEHGQESMSTDVCVEDDEYEELDDFDPYLFIKNLPELSSVVPTFRPMLLPKQTRSCPPTTLVLDLDGKKFGVIHLFSILYIHMIVTGEMFSKQGYSLQGWLFVQLDEDVF